MNDKKSELSESLEALEKALEAGEYTGPSPVLKVEDLMPLASRYLTEGARYDLSQKASTLFVKEEDGKVFKAVYFSAVVRSGNEEKAVQALARVVNDLSQRGLIHSCLAPVSALELARMPLEAHKSVVFCFVLVPESYEAYCSVRYKKFFTLEGGVGPNIDDMRPYLQPGEFLTSIRISHIPMIQEGARSPRELLNDQIMTYIAILPKGTVVRQIVECAITDLSYPFEVKFYNPLFQDIKSVELEHVRAIAKITDDKVSQFNLITGIKYFDADQRKLFDYSRK